MNYLLRPEDFMSMSLTILLLLLTANRYVDTSELLDDDDDEEGHFDPLCLESQCSLSELDSITSATLHSMHISTAFAALDDELRYWVKLRSMTWFSRFFVQEYGDECWMRLFLVTKKVVFALADLLRPQIQRQDTKYRLAVPVVVRVACTLFKLTHGASLLVCSDFFAVGRSTMSLMLRQMVHAINNALRS